MSKLLAAIALVSASLATGCIGGGDIDSPAPRTIGERGVLQFFDGFGDEVLQVQPGYGQSIGVEQRDGSEIAGAWTVKSLDGQILTVPAGEGGEVTPPIDNASGNATYVQGVTDGATYLVVTDLAGHEIDRVVIHVQPYSS